MNRAEDSTPADQPDPPITDRWLTIPNLVTMARFLLAPIFVWFMVQGEYWPALLTLIVQFSTDWLDGFLARVFNQRSKVGQWLDPLADRLALWIVVITVVLSGLAPLWLVFALVVPDLILAGVMALIYAGNPQMRVTLLGKTRTAALMVGAPLLLFAEAPFVDSQLWHNVALGVLTLGAAGHIMASLDYLVHGLKNAQQMRRQHLDPRSKTDREAFLDSA